jgi:chromosome segregation ATPase
MFCKDLYRNFLPINNMATLLETQLSNESQRFDDAASRLESHRGNQNNAVKIIELLRVQLHHIQRMHQHLHSASFSVAKELNQLLGRLQGKQKNIRADYKAAKKVKGTDVTEAQHVLRSVNAQIAHLQAVRTNLLQHTKQHTSSMELLAREARNKEDRPCPEKNKSVY